MPARINALLQLLTLESAGKNIFIGAAAHEPHVRAFGGLVAAQALMAAGRTVPYDRRPHSLHSYFLRPGAPNDEITYQTEVTRDGQSFSTRRVEAIQRNKVIFQLSASFHRSETGIEHSDDAPEVTRPENLQSFDERFAGRSESDMSRWFMRARPFDIRYVQNSPFDFSQAGTPAAQQVWVKTLEAVPTSSPDIGSATVNDQLLHCAVFTYISDMTVLDAILLRHGIKWTDEHILGASLDHALWFHRPFRVDSWLLLDQESPVAGGGLGLARGRVWTESGHLVATIAQEALMRPPTTHPNLSPTTHPNLSPTTHPNLPPTTHPGGDSGA